MCFVRAKLKEDYMYDAIEKYGYQIMIPYRDTNLFMRLMREVWFRLGLPFRCIWLNPKLKKIDQDIIIVRDSLVCSELMEWLRNRYPTAKLILDYDNRADNTFSPTEACKYVNEMWTYDADDAKKYGMRIRGTAFLDIYKLPEFEETTPIDVAYLGRDKGRGEEILGIESELMEKGFSTDFKIVANRQYQRYRKKYYSPLTSYREYLEMLSRSKALLNFMPESQKSLTPRDMESIFYSKKEITNVKEIKEFKYYHPQRQFVWGVDDMESLGEFLNSPYPKLSEEELDEFRFVNCINEMLDE